MSSKTCIKATDTINKKGIEEYFMVGYLVARTGKPYTIVEDLNSSCYHGYDWDNAGGTGQKNYTDNYFIKQHCFTTHQ